MRNLKTVVGIVLGLASFGARASQTCTKAEEARIKKSLGKKKIFKCLFEASVLPDTQAGKDQAVILYSQGLDGVSLAVFPTLLQKGIRLSGPKPLYVFTGLGEHPQSFSSSEGSDIQLLVKDLDGDGFAEIVALPIVQPNASLVVKSYDNVKHKYRDFAFKTKADDDEELSVVVAPDESLQVPDSIKDPFVVKGAKETRNYQFSKYVD